MYRNKTGHSFNNKDMQTKHDTVAITSTKQGTVAMVNVFKQKMTHLR